MSEYDADHLEQGVANAIADGNLPAAVEILKMLARLDAERAALVLKTIKVSLAIASENAHE